MPRAFTILFLLVTAAGAQSPERYLAEVTLLKKKYDSLWDSSRKTIVFTGSSSIRLWPNLETLFPEHQLVNTGFGGSQTSDLLANVTELVLRFEPESVWIYEGDNDLYEGESPREILADMNALIARIRSDRPGTHIFLISAKPSLARWHLRNKYKKLNGRFEKICDRDSLLTFINVWDPMLGTDKKVRTDIFIQDGLHMNELGYQLWYETIRDHIH